jgi:tRNA(Ile)-lysidine synthase
MQSLIFSRRSQHEREPLLEHFLTYLTSGCRVEPGEVGIVGVSGGADSTALALLAAEAASRLRLRLTVISVDHGLRPESAAEAEAVGELCRRLGLAFRAVAVDARRRASEGRHCLEEAARLERLEALETARRLAGADWVALGHTRTDQAETVLQRLRRGTGIDGLACMAPRRDRLIRPLLWAGRGEVREYLRSLGVGWCEDPTNLDPRFERSRVRAQLLPRIEESVAAELAVEAAKLGAVLARGEAAWIESHARALPRALLLTGDALASLSAPVAARIVRRAAHAVGDGVAPLSRSSTRALADLGRGPGGRELHLPRRTAWRLGGKGAGLVIGVPAGAPPRATLTIDGPGRYRAAPLRMTVVVGSDRPRSPIWGVVQGDEPFEVRLRMPGDRLATDGKKVKRLLQRIGVELHLRNWVPLVVRNSMVLWTAARPSRIGPGSIVSFQLDPGHPLRSWAAPGTW